MLRNSTLDVCSDGRRRLAAEILRRLAAAFHFASGQPGSREQAGISVGPALGARRSPAVLVACGLACLLAPAVEGAEPGPRFLVAVHNYSGVSRETLARAESEATRVFDKAGIKLEWLDLAISSEGSGRSVDDLLQGAPACYLKLVPDSTLDKLKRPTGELGFASGTTIYVFTGSAQRLSMEVAAKLSTVLGHIIAHEIGHVLLGQNSHARSTIMAPQLGIKELVLVFSKPQANRMQERLLAQQAGETAVLLAQR